MFCFSILKLKIFPFHNFCSFTLLLYTQSVISEAQLLRKKRPILTLQDSRACAAIFLSAQEHLQFPLVRVDSFNSKNFN